MLKSVLLLLFLSLAFGAVAQSTNSTVELSRIIEAAGKVECMTGGSTNWRSATVGTPLVSGDRVRTREQSRAAIQLSDRSVVRLNERTTVEILPPRHAEKKRFGVPHGSIFFFDREKPADVEFDTPLAAGAIRGTEFLLQIEETNSALRLAMVDGLVALQTSAGEISAGRREDVHIAFGQASRKTALVNVNSVIQWALYYPAVLNLDELSLTADETSALSEVRDAYRAGDLLAALAKWPASFSAASSDAQVFHAALKLSVGEIADAEAMLSQMSPESSGVSAVRELISTVRGEVARTNIAPRSASEWLARSYTLQRATDLPKARTAARRAVERTPEFGFAHARLAELEFAFGNHHAALNELDRALTLAPRFAPAHALRGFVLLEQGDVHAALAAFDRARELDAAFGPAWLGRGLCLMRQRKFVEARAAFQAASALEPDRAVFRSYFGKAGSELGETKAAEKEFDLAKRLDPKDPTGWLYSALHLWQQNRINEAFRDLEQAETVNDYRAPFRSRLLLDRDRSVASADLAVIYDDAGLSEVSRHTAARAVTEDYANFSGHLFFANSLQTMEDVNRFDLRFETARQSELLVANLLAPAGAGNLSQQLSQQEHLRFFNPRPMGVSSLTEYDSRGNWTEAGTIYGSADGFSYAFDAQYNSFNGDRPNNEFESRQFALTVKQRVTADDEVYFQVGHFKSDAGDVAQHFDPAETVADFRAKETQEPTLYAGWHRAWSPGSHTLLLLARLDDSLAYTNPEPNEIFLFQSGGVVSGVQRPPIGPPFRLDFDSRVTVYSAELQQIWETPRDSLVIGGRWQSGEIKTHAQLNREMATNFVRTVTDQDFSTHLTRGDVYAYGTWKVCDALQFIGGANYSRLRFPENTDLPPISAGEATRDLFSPKAGVLFAPWEGGMFRADYTKSLGGLFFDNSVRLEPTQIGGFNQAFRSLIPESVEGLVPGTEFETAGIGFDQSLKSGTFFGVEAEWLTSHGSRTVGVLTNEFVFAEPDSPSGTRQTLRFRERDLSAYAGQLLGNYFSLSARYRLSEAHLVGRFPEIPNSVPGLSGLEQNDRATLHQLSLAANVNLPNGFFGRWESDWLLQNSSGNVPGSAGSDFWQHNIMVGYRFDRRRAEVRLAVLNLFDADYRLNPLNLHPVLPRSRTLVASFRLNF